MSNQSSPLSELAQQVQGLEDEGARLTARWYREAPTDNEDIGQLNRVTQSSIHCLNELSRKLDDRLQAATDESRQAIQYAYNLVAELLQSRIASQEMLQTIRANDKEQYREYFRALSLKEKAALSQANKLVDTIQKIH